MTTENQSTQVSILRTLWSATRHNGALVLATLIAASLGLWCLGCESQVASLADPNVQVSRGELVIEFNQSVADLQQKADLLTQQYDLKLGQLDKLDSLKKSFLALGQAVAEGGSLNVTGLVGIAAGILGIGAVVDNRRKDTVIQVQKRELARATIDTNTDTATV